MTRIDLSAVVQLVSAFDGLPIEVGVPAFSIGGVRQAAHAKPQGFYAFTGLGEGTHELRIALAGFFPARATLSVPLPPSIPLAEAIVACVLDPAPTFAYPAWTAVLRGRVTAAGAPPVPLPHASVVASYAGRDGRERRVTTASAEGGRWDGRYAIGLPGRRSGTVDVTVTFSARDRDAQVRSLRLEPGRPAFLDVALG